MDSLRVGTDLKVPDLRVVRVGRHPMGDVAPGHPGIWTFLDVEAPDERADELAEALADRLSGPGWYADFRVGEEHVVIYPGRVFRYPVSDADGRAAAVRYGVGAGVPPENLDWDDEGSAS